MKMSSSILLSIFLLISAVSMTSVSAGDWKDGDNGAVHWDSYCRYAGQYMTYKYSSDRQCGGVCLAQPGCTHFTQGDGVCYLYNTPYRNNDDHKTARGWVCGYIPGRSFEPLYNYGR